MQDSRPKLYFTSTAPRQAVVYHCDCMRRLNTIYQTALSLNKYNLLNPKHVDLD